MAQAEFFNAESDKVHKEEPEWLWIPFCYCTVLLWYDVLCAVMAHLSLTIFFVVDKEDLEKQLNSILNGRQQPSSNDVQPSPLNRELFPSRPDVTPAIQEDSTKSNSKAGKRAADSSKLEEVYRNFSFEYLYHYLSFMSFFTYSIGKQES